MTALLARLLYNQNRGALKWEWSLERGFILHENMNRMVTEKSCLRREQWSLIRVVFGQEFNAIINIASTDPQNTHTHNTTTTTTTTTTSTQHPPPPPQVLISVTSTYLRSIHR